MGRTLFDELDDEWSRLGESRAGKRAVAKWDLVGASELTTLAALHDEISKGQASDISNSLFRQVIERARDDALAKRLALQCMMPAMRTAARRWWTTDDWIDVQSTVITETLDRISRYPVERRMGWVAANISRDVNQSISRRVARRLSSNLENTEPTDHVRTSANNELMDLLKESKRWGAVDPIGIDLIVQTRILDRSPKELSDLYGIKTSSLRRRRQRAEQRLEAFVNG